MIRFGGTDGDGTRVIGIGLSRENCKRLLEGRPIAYRAQSSEGDQEIEILIMAGETEDAVEAELRFAIRKDGKMVIKPN